MGASKLLKVEAVSSENTGECGVNFPEASLLCRSLSVAIYSVLAVVMLALPLNSVWAAGESNVPPSADICEADSPLCRRIAVEVAKLEFTEVIRHELVGRRAGALLCPETDPDCCPPQLGQVCAQKEMALVRQARRKLHKENSDSICDLWPPGCRGFPGDVFECPAGSVLGDFGMCLELVNPLPIPDPSPLPCPCGWTSNVYGGCSPKPCPGRLLNLACTFGCFPDTFKAAERRQGEGSTLMRYLGEKEVQVEAIRHLREDLKNELDALERHVKKISKAQ